MRDGDAVRRNAVPATPTACLPVVTKSLMVTYRSPRLSRRVQVTPSGEVKTRAWLLGFAALPAPRMKNEPASVVT
ncbi:MAG: hypothetical protein HY901_16135 [Deltaproteobacteria bacterium]|nr:hypothetical protein [Deltaproteobacteria bacterium]